MDHIKFFCWYFLQQLTESLFTQVRQSRFLTIQTIFTRSFYSKFERTFVQHNRQFDIVNLTVVGNMSRHTKQKIIPAIQNCPYGRIGMGTNLQWSIDHNLWSGLFWPVLRGIHINIVFYHMEHLPVMARKLLRNQDLSASINLHYSRWNAVQPTIEQVERATRICTAVRTPCWTGRIELVLVCSKLASRPFTAPSNSTYCIQEPSI